MSNNENKDIYVYCMINFNNGYMRVFSYGVLDQLQNVKNAHGDSIEELNEIYNNSKIFIINLSELFQNEKDFPNLYLDKWFNMGCCRFNLYHRTEFLRLYLIGEYEEAIKMAKEPFKINERFD